MSEPDRRAILDRAATVVVKVGTNVLADAAGNLDKRRIESLADQLHRVTASGRRVALVSSGAIGAGVGLLKLRERPTELPHLQACAAVGQPALMQLYQDALARHGVTAAQVLLTAGDFDHRVRYLNARNTLRTLFEYGCLPVINENDTVSVAEIKFTDNDQLAAMVANLLAAPLLVLLTNVDGLFSADPRVDPTAARLTTVERIDPAVTRLAAETQSRLGTGGMRSKLRAAKVATAAGGAVVIADGSVDGVLDRVFAGEEVGTLFLPDGDALPARKRWLGLTAQPKGQLVLDAGAAQAVRTQGKSLLPVGVRRVLGEFGRGDVVVLCDEAGEELARGLVNYASVEAGQLAGKKTGGGASYVELVHRDNLVLTDARGAGPAGKPE